MVNSSVQMKAEILQKRFGRVPQPIIDAALPDNGFVNLMVFTGKGNPGHFHVAIGLGIDTTGNRFFLQ